MLHLWHLLELIVGRMKTQTRVTRLPSTRCLPHPQAAAELTTPAEEDAEKGENSMSMYDASALVQDGLQRPPPEEEAARSEVDAKADEFIKKFNEKLRQERLKSIFNYKEMLKRS
jgi:hypothetical protein